MTKAEQALVDDKMRAEIAKLTAETIKLNKEIKWYEAIVIAGGASGLTLALLALAKFLVE